MGLMPDNIISINIHGCNAGDQNSFETLIKEKLNEILMSLQTLSKEVGELRTQVTDLKAAIDTEQQQVGEAVDRLNATIATLQDQIANGATPAQLEAVAAEIIAVRNDLTAAKEDLASTIPDAPQGGGGNGETPGGDIGTPGGQTGEGNEPPTGSEGNPTQPGTGL
jgi:ABC-type transporter Mla subunit MlaD